jgi:hypothetical protein
MTRLHLSVFFLSQVRSDAFSFCLTPVGKTSIPLAPFSFFFKTLKSKKKSKDITASGVFATRHAVTDSDALPFVFFNFQFHHSYY